jgi:hypothetical protein
LRGLELKSANFSNALIITYFGRCTKSAEEPLIRPSQLGNARLRKALYFPAIVARQHNEIVKEFAKRLKKRGKTPMQIVCAAMRKLLHIAFGVLKHKRAFDSSLAFSA